MLQEVEFGKFFTLLNSVKEGEKDKNQEILSMLGEYKERKGSNGYLDELGRVFLYIGVSELYKYAGTQDMEKIGRINKEGWEELADSNKGQLPTFLANNMIEYAKDNKLAQEIAGKWEVKKKEVEKHTMNMARYITEGIIDVIE